MSPCVHENPAVFTVHLWSMGYGSNHWNVAVPWIAVVVFPFLCVPLSQCFACRSLLSVFRVLWSQSMFLFSCSLSVVRLTEHVGIPSFSLRSYFVCNTLLVLTVCVYFLNMSVCSSLSVDTFCSLSVLLCLQLCPVTDCWACYFYFQYLH